MLVIAVLTWFCAAARGSKYVPENAGQSMDVFRLPATTRPESYDLRFVLSLNGNRSTTFGGMTKIIFSAVSATDVVTLNLKDLNVTEVAVTDVSDPVPSDLSTSRLENRAQNEQFEIHLASQLSPGRRYLVTIVYEGSIQTDPIGLYIKSFMDGDVTKWLAVTHLQPVYARRVFPCYDEPSYKAVFNISVIKHKNYIALSNMPVQTVIEGPNDMEMVSFESTPSMSSYLVGIFVGEFVSNKNDSLIAVYSRKDNINRTEYIRVEASKHLQVLEEYTGIKYMLPKLDMVVIPDDYFTGMENWGITIYEENYLLVNEKSKNLVISTRLVQHEFTHQWFGNLVTCSWWDFAWLNEGITKYFEYFATGMVKTSWPMEELFVVEELLESLKHDQYLRLPITRSVHTVKQIVHVFDVITYGKAASVLRMLRHMVTENLFRLSIREYLNKNQGDVVDPSKLYVSFDNVLENHGYALGDGLTVNQFMMNWTLQSGYPVIKVTKNDTSNTFSITQKRFFINPTDEKQHSYNVSAWRVGLAYTTETSANFNHTAPSVWTNQTSHLTVIPAPADSGWFIFNVQMTGFYRVNYDTANWMALIEQLKESTDTIHVLNRIQLIDDSFNLANAGQLSFLIPLSLTEYLVNERSVYPWLPAMKALSHLYHKMPCRAEGYVTLKTHISNLAGVVFKLLDDLALNGAVNVENFWVDFAWAYSLDNEYCAAKALERFEKWRAGEKIPDIFTKAAFCMGVKNSSGPDTFNQMFNLNASSTSFDEHYSAKTALGCSKNRTQLFEYISHILDGPQGLIMTNEIKAVIYTISMTPLGLEVIYEFLVNNWNKILSEVQSGKSIVTTIYSILALRATNERELQKIIDLKNNSSIPISIRLDFEEALFKLNSIQQRWLDMKPEGISQWALKYEGEKDKNDTQNTTTELTNDLNRDQLRAYVVYPEKISKWALEHNEINVEGVEKYELNNSTSVETNPKRTNNAFIVLLFVIFLILLCTMFYLLK